MAVVTRIRLLIIYLTGYFIYKKRDLPVGVDFKEDLISKFKIVPRCIFDVGANYGQTALHYHTLFKNAKIFSFEPVKSSFEKLVSCTSGISNVSCFHLALGEENTKTEITLFDESNSQLNSLKAVNSPGQGHSKEIIEVIKLDTFADQKKISEIDLLKIDTEGFEIEVLKGAGGFLKNNNIKAILCEVALSGKNKRNTQLHYLIDFLDNYDYFFVSLYDTNVNYFRDGLAYSNALFVKK